MASQKRLKDLLQEDQEPFLLQSFISGRRCQIKPHFSPRTDLQVTKRRPMSQNAGFPSRFCRNACFFSFRESPDPRKSPLFEFRSPNRSPNVIFLNIPTKTAAILLEAAVRIQKQSSSKGSKTRKGNVGNAFGLFGSVLKKLTNRKKREVGNASGRVSVKDILRWESPFVSKIITRNAICKGIPENAVEINAREESVSETRFSRRSNSSGVWSESYEDKSWDCDLETSSSSGCSQSDGQDELKCEILDGVDLTEDHEKRFCESPFHFVLQSSPSHRSFQTPKFASSAASPSRGGQKNEERCQIEEEEEEKEQNSPVSVLDPPFQDDDEDIRTKHKLIKKLRRFEQLVGINPIELEKKMSSNEELNEDSTIRVYHRSYHHEITRRVLEKYLDEFKRIPGGIQSLISDIIEDEFQQKGFAIDDDEALTRRVCERLESWRDVEVNTIDMMIEEDFRAQSVLGLWVKHEQETREISMEIERGIFRYLLEEFSEELIQDWGFH